MHTLLIIQWRRQQGGLYLEWKAGTLIQPTGVTLFILGVILGILTSASYLWLLRLTENENG